MRRRSTTLRYMPILLALFAAGVGAVSVVAQSGAGHASPNRPRKLQYVTAVADTQPNQARKSSPNADPFGQVRVMGSKGIGEAEGFVLPARAKGEESTAIAFGSGDFVPPAGEKIQPALAQTAQERAQQMRLQPQAARGADRPSVFGLIVLDTWLDDALEARLKALGVELFGFYPHSAYQARIPIAALPGVASIPHVRWIGQPTPDQKVSAELSPLAKGFAAWADRPQPVYVNLFGPDKHGEIGAALQAAGADVGDYDADLNTYYAEADAKTIRRIAALDAVLSVEEVPICTTKNLQSVPSINADYLWGVFDPLPPNSGRQVKVGIMDSGVYMLHRDFSRVFRGTWGYSLIPGENWYDDLGTPGSPGHGTHVAGSMIGEGLGDNRYRGVAAGLESHGDPERNPDLLVAQVFNRNGNSANNSTMKGLEVMQADYSWSQPAGQKRQVFNFSGGAFVVGATGTDPLSRKVDKLFADNILPVIAAGNDGSGPGGATVWSSINRPGVAKGALTVGAVFNNNYVAGSGYGWLGNTDQVCAFSSRGNTGDGRQKPDVVAPGAHIMSAWSQTANWYFANAGTSMATPHVTGLAAGLMGRFPQLSAWAIKAGIIASAIDLAPANRASYGWGKVDAMLAHYAIDGEHIFYWDTIRGTGSVQYADFTLPRNVSNLRIVLVYPDPPAAANAAIALKNDLDLYLQVPPFTQGPGGQWQSTSTRDNVEVINLNIVPAGQYRFKVHDFRQNEGRQQPWAVAIQWTYGSTSPNVQMTLTTPRSAKPDEAFNALVSATASSYVASGVYGQLDLTGAPGFTIDAMWYNRRGRPSTGSEWFPFPNPIPPAWPWYQWTGMNMGDIAKDRTREMRWELKAGRIEGRHRIRFRVTPSNAPGGFVDQIILVDVTPPEFGAIDAANWRNGVTCRLRDVVAGLDVASGQFRYSKDNGRTWSDWSPAACTGDSGTNDWQTLTARFDAAPAPSILIQFQACDILGNCGQSGTAFVGFGRRVTVTANPLWTDTGVTLTAGMNVQIHNAAGQWSWGTPFWGTPIFGPDGDAQPDVAWDEWITNGMHGQLIGVVLPEGVDPNTFPRVVPQNSPALFTVGSGSVVLRGQTGRLWLGFNDDYFSERIADNAGSVTADLDFLP